ncbi:hypothetical protein [Tahibacter amnicola]|uniref:DUF1579 domain-containing protein n=1 Tax=Tahibacter amnicola TaxID=2976241 RepID=A0ABY6B736_9GAMM|nr:hypothetical protein [Tahibacter amnicola]UXI65918.1 hypothetical protein N4264_14255 [Tahibacter amnicola]
MRPLLHTRFVKSLFAVGLASPLAAAAPEPVHAANAGPPGTVHADGRHDFDFLVGRWYAHTRRLVRPLQQSDQWEAFYSVHDGVLLPGGLGVADDYRIEGRPDFLGLALQIYDPDHRQWRAYWYRQGAMTPPLLGRFSDGVGVFEGPDQLDGRAILTRYTWKDITAASARWEQAFSGDGGKTWETNWVMEYSREPFPRVVTLPPGKGATPEVQQPDDQQFPANY